MPGDENEELRKAREVAAKEHQGGDFGNGDNATTEHQEQKESPEVKFKRQLESEAAAFSLTLKKLDELVLSLSAPGQRPERSTERQKQKSLESALATCHAVGNRLQAAQLEAAGVYEQYKAAETIVSRRHIQSLKDIESLNQALGQVPALLAAYENKVQEIDSVKVEFPVAMSELHRYTYGQIHELQDQARRIGYKVTALEESWFGGGKKIHQKKIDQLRAEHRNLVTKQSALREQYEQVERSYKLEPTAHDLRGYNGHQLVVQGLEKIRGRFENLLRQTAFEQPESRQRLPEQVVAELDNQYLDEYVLPQVPVDIAQIEEEKASEALEIRPDPDRLAMFNLQIQNLSTPELVQQGMEALRASFAIKMSSEDKRFPEVDAQISALPVGVRSLVHNCLRWQHCVDEDYRAMVNFCDGFDRIEPRDAVEQTYAKVLGQIKVFCKENQAYTENRLPGWVIDQDLGKLKSMGARDQFYKYLQGFYAEQWEIFCDNPQVQQLIGPERLGQAREFLGDKLLEDYIDRNNMISWMNLRRFRPAKAIPLMVLGAYAIPDGLLTTRSIDIKRSPLYEVLSSLTPKELERVSQLQIPGLDRAVTLIRGNFEDVLYPAQSAGGEGFKMQAEMHQCLTDMDAYLLETGNDKVQIFALRQMASLPAETLGNSYTTIAGKLRNKAPEEFQTVAVDSLVRRAAAWSDTKAAITLLENSQNLSGPALVALHEKTPFLLARLAVANVKDETLLRIAAIFLGKTTVEVQSLFSLLAELHKVGHHFNSDKTKNFDQYFPLAENPQLRLLIIELHNYGYTFDINHTEALPTVLTNKASVIAEIKEIRQFIPSFHYGLIREAGGWAVGPYAILVVSYQPAALLEACRKIAGEEQETIRQKCFSAMLGNLRVDDPKLKHSLSLEERKNPPEQTTLDFNVGLKELLDKTGEGQELAEFKNFFTNAHALRYIAREPGKMKELLSLPKAVPELFDLLAAGGPLHSNSNNVIRDIFENGDAVGRARQVTSIFVQRGPYWERLFFYTQARLGESLRAAISNYPVSDIGGSTVNQLIEDHKRHKISGSTELSQLECIIADPQILTDIDAKGTAQVTFRHLHGVYKELVFKDILKRSIESSHLLVQKQKADLRNRGFAQKNFSIAANDYLHASAIDYLPSILEHGNLPGEALGETAKEDSFPFQVDFSVITPQLLEEHKKTPELINSTMSARENYGTRGSLGEAGKIFYVYDRNNTAWEKGKGSFGYGPHHGLMLGAMPATEISAIVLGSPEATLEKSRQEVVANGFYIPLYNMEGELLFTVEEYDRMLAEAKPYSSIQNLLADQSYLADLDKPQASSLHKFTLKEHLLRVTDRASVMAQEYGLPVRDSELVTLAARLHDIGKGTAELNLQQWYDNPTAAVAYLKKVRNLDYEEVKDVLYMIQHDELLGDILQGKKLPEEFKKLFVSEREQKMLLALYRADVMEIDGTGELYKQWQVDEKIQSLGFQP